MIGQGCSDALEAEPAAGLDQHREHSGGSSECEVRKRSPPSFARRMAGITATVSLSATKSGVPTMALSSGRLPQRKAKVGLAKSFSRGASFLN